MTKHVHTLTITAEDLGAKNIKDLKVRLVTTNRRLLIDNFGVDHPRTVFPVPIQGSTDANGVWTTELISGERYTASLSIANGEPLTKIFLMPPRDVRLSELADASGIPDTPVNPDAGDVATTAQLNAEKEAREHGDVIKFKSIADLAALNTALTEQEASENALVIKFTGAVTYNSVAYPENQIAYVPPKSNEIEAWFVDSGGSGGGTAITDINNVPGTLNVNKGGTGATNAVQARANLGAASAADLTSNRNRIEALENRRFAAELKVFPESIRDASDIQRNYTFAIENEQQDLLFDKHTSSPINRIRVRERNSGAVIHEEAWSYSSNDWVFQGDINASEANAIGNLGSAEFFEVRLEFGRGSGGSFSLLEESDWFRIAISNRGEMTANLDELRHRLNFIVRSSPSHIDKNNIPSRFLFSTISQNGAFPDADRARIIMFGRTRDFTGYNPSVHEHSFAWDLSDADRTFIGSLANGSVHGVQVTLRSSTTNYALQEIDFEITEGATGGGGDSDTAAQIKTKLESLSGDDRLDASAVKNLPDVPDPNDHSITIDLDPDYWVDHKTQYVTNYEIALHFSRTNPLLASATSLNVELNGQPLLSTRQAWTRTDGGTRINVPVSLSIQDTLTDNIVSAADRIAMRVLFYNAGGTVVAHSQIRTLAYLASLPPDTEGLNQSQVDARVKAGVLDWAETGNTDPIPTSKTPPRTQALTSAATITWNVDDGNIGTLTAGHNFTLNITGGENGSFAVLRVLQDATGSRTMTLNSAIVLDGRTAPTLSTAANAHDNVMFMRRGTTWVFLGAILNG